MLCCIIDVNSTRVRGGGGGFKPLFFQQGVLEPQIKPVKRTGTRPTGGCYKQAKLIPTAISDVAVLNIYGVVCTLSSAAEQDNS